MKNTFLQKYIFQPASRSDVSLSDLVGLSSTAPQWTALKHYGVFSLSHNTSYLNLFKRSEYGIIGIKTKEKNL